MAVELAVQGKKEETLAILNQIESNSATPSILLKVHETKAELYLQVLQYDSALYFAKKISRYQSNEPIGLLICAQAYSLMGIKDSATYYAKEALDKSTSLYNKYNLLYVVTNDDRTKDIEAIRQVASERADIQKNLLAQKGNLSQATQLLEQDLTRKPDMRWLYVVIGVFLLISSCSILYYILRKRKQHQLIIADLQEKETIQVQLEQSITNLSQLQDSKHEQMIVEIEHSCQLFRESSDIKTDLCWKDYKKLCDILNQQFYLLALKLQQLEEINERDVRLCALVLLDLSHATIADLMCVEESSVGKLKERTARKLKTSRKNMRQVLINIILGDN